MPSKAGQEPDQRLRQALALTRGVGREALRLGGRFRAAQPARRIAGQHIALHADPADIDTLIELLGVIGGIVRGNAKLLLWGVVRLLTGRKAGRQHHQAKETSPSHRTLSSAPAFRPAETRPDQIVGFTTIGGHNWFCTIVSKMSANHRPNVTSR